MMPPDAAVHLPVASAYDLRSTAFALTWDKGNPTRRMHGGVLWYASWFAGEPATLAAQQDSRGVRVLAWGPGAEEALRRAPAICGLRDDPSAFRPEHRLLRELRSRHAGQRLVATGEILRELVPVVLGQLVTTKDAAIRYRSLCLRFGEPAPGPSDLVLPPTVERLTALPAWQFTRLGIPRKQADAIRRCLDVAPRLQAAIDLPHDEGMALLQQVRGVGPWTAGHVLANATGWPDTVILGDLHVPRQVGLGLVGEPEADDARMLELLEPHRPHRYRVLRLLFSGGPRPPRKGPLGGRDPRWRGPA